MVYIGNQGQDDRYIHLRSCSISHPVVSRLHQCLLTTDHGNACMSSTISSIIFSRCWKSKCYWHLESRVCCSRTRIKVRTSYKSHSENFMHGFLFLFATNLIWQWFMTGLSTGYPNTVSAITKSFTVHSLFTCVPVSFWSV